MSRCKWHYLLMVVLNVSLISRKRNNVLSVHWLKSNGMSSPVLLKSLAWDGGCHRLCFVGVDGSCAVCLPRWGVRCLAAHIPVIIPSEQAGSRSSGRLWLRGLDTRGGRASLQADWEAALTDRSSRNDWDPGWRAECGVDKRCKSELW